MRPKQDLIPQVTRKNKTEFLITLWYENKRYRYSNGKPIEVNISPNKAEVKLRKRQAEVLCAAYTMAIENGWRPARSRSKPTSLEELSNQALEKKLSLGYSKTYKRDLIYTHKKWMNYLKQEQLMDKPISDLKISVVSDFIRNHSPSDSGMIKLRGNLSSLLQEELGIHNVQIKFSKIKLPKKVQTLHKPISDLEAVFNELQAYNENLYLCCLMTYSMLLRPHREVRSLRFKDFDSDYKTLSLDGSRVKSKRNRIVPVPSRIKEILVARETNRDANIFSQNNKEFNDDYFKTLWSRYKNNSMLIEPEQTLYSFRHTGAIEVFKKTGSLHKLQQLMDHSDMKVSLTYLRGLEVKQLDVEDLPNL